MTRTPRRTLRIPDAKWDAGWPLNGRMVEAIIREYRGRDPVPRIRAAEMELGRFYLDRRARGDKTELGWTEYRDTVWVRRRQLDQSPRSAISREHRE